MSLITVTHLLCNLSVHIPHLQNGFVFCGSGTKQALSSITFKVSVFLLVAIVKFFEILCKSLKLYINKKRNFTNDHSVLKITP